MGRPAFTNASRRALDPERVLAALALAFAVAQLTEAALSHHAGVRAVTLVFALLTPVPLTFAWRAPLASLLTVDLLFLLQAALGGRLLDTSEVAVFLCVVGIFLVGLRAPTRDLVVAGVAAVGLLTATSVLEGVSGDMASGILWVTIVPVGIPALAGRVLRSRNALNRRLDEQAREIECNRAEREAAAVLGERTRIARELHDVVAHDVSVMLVQAAAAKRTVPADPERARAAIAAVEDTGREALGELRRLLGVLRRGDEELALAPQPSLHRIGTLVQRMRATGLPVELEVAGDPVHLPPGVDAAAFRIVQEALVNIVRHAAATRASVRVDYEPQAVELVVSDDGAGDGPIRDGRGLVNLRERVALYGGELRAGRRRPRGFELRARLPVGAPAA
ncbi:MAG TPA: histidine kinase [Solirubrobacteraceae bacterium]